MRKMNHVMSILLVLISFTYFEFIIGGDKHSTKNNDNLSSQTTVSTINSTPVKKKKKPLPDIEELICHDYFVHSCFYDFSYIEDYESLPDDGRLKEFILRSGGTAERQEMATLISHCPYTAFCTNPAAGSFYSREYYPCCSSCSCDDDCLEFNTCCPDYRNTTVSSNDSTPSKECTPMFLNLNTAAYRSRTSYSTYAVRTCPNKTTYPDWFKCEKVYSTTNESHRIVDILPVVGTTTGVVYRNEHCAFCNGVQASSLESFEPHFGCQKGGAFPKFASETDLIRFVLESDDNCDIWFESESAQLDQCGTMISECNATGKWSKYDQKINEACKKYFLPILMIDDITFKNVFCAMCNGYNNIYRECRYSTNYDKDLDFSFAGLLKYTKEKDIRAMNKSCVNHITLSKKDQCVRMHCSEFRQLDDYKCERHILKTDLYYYEITLKLTPAHKSINLWDNITTEILDSVATLLKSRLSSVVANKSNIHLCALDAFLETDTDCAINAETEVMEVMIYYVRVTVYINDDHDPEQVAQTVRNISVLHALSGDMRVTTTNNFYSYVVCNGTRERNLCSVNTSSLQLTMLNDNYRVCSTVSNKSLVHHLQFEYKCYYLFSFFHPTPKSLQAIVSCPFVTLDSTKYNWRATENGITFSKTGYTVDSNHFFYNGDDNNISLCVEEFRAMLSISEQRSLRVSAGFIVSNVFTILSILCLLFTFGVFVLLEPLRNLPGKNNMALISSLMVAQVCYLLGSYTPLYTDLNSLACKLIGLAIHFFWLLAIFWMNVCTFHVCRVLTRTRAISQSQGTKRFVIYHGYCAMLAAIFVSANVAVSATVTDNPSIGYGGRACYISSQRMNVFTFIIPVGLVIVSNLAMFLVVIITIKKSSTMQKNVQNERNDLAIFAKLSTLTGLTWVFGYVYIWTDSEVFHYLFIVLNAGQGVFLMMALVCNRRVLGMIRSRKYARGSTDNTQSSKAGSKSWSKTNSTSLND